MCCLFDFEAGRAVEVLLLTSKKRICGFCEGPLMTIWLRKERVVGFLDCVGGGGVNVWAVSLVKVQFGR